MLMVHLKHIVQQIGSCMLIIDPAMISNFIFILPCIILQNLQLNVRLFAG